MDIEGHQRVTVRVSSELGSPHIVRGTHERCTGKLQAVGYKDFVIHNSPNMKLVD